MGIDARIIIQTTTEVTPEKLRDWSFAIAESLGAERFFIDRKERQAISLTRDYDEQGRDGHIYYQDGPEVVSDKTLLEVSVWTRYYGEGYERGDILFICAVAEWAEANIPDCEVWYGGDSSGVLLEPFPAARRQELRNLLYSAKGRDYFKHSWADSKSPRPDLSDCKLCIEDRLNQYGIGANGSYAAYLCPGCGERFITRDGGQTWSNKDE